MCLSILASYRIDPNAPSFPRRRESSFSKRVLFWIPTCAGMTEIELSECLPKSGGETLLVELEQFWKFPRKFRNSDRLRACPARIAKGFENAQSLLRRYLCLRLRHPRGTTSGGANEPSPRPIGSATAAVIKSADSPGSHNHGHPGVSQSRFVAVGHRRFLGKQSTIDQFQSLLPVADASSKCELEPDASRRVESEYARNGQHSGTQRMECECEPRFRIEFAGIYGTDSLSASRVLGSLNFPCLALR